MQDLAESGQSGAGRVFPCDGTRRFHGETFQYSGDFQSCPDGVVGFHHVNNERRVCVVSVLEMR
jgi:hypothetical protein